MKKIDVESGVRIYSGTKDDVKDAIDLIGQEVYISDWLDFNPYTKDKLAKVIYEEDNNVWCKGEKPDNCYHRYFILAKDAKFIEEKKLRPYKDISEFCVKTGCIEIGKDLITIRNKNTQKEYELLYVGYSDGEVHLGGYILTFADLLKNYEHALNSFEWLPFGIEE